MKKSDEIREKIAQKKEQIEKRKKTTEKFEAKKVKMGQKLKENGAGHIFRRFSYTARYERKSMEALKEQFVGSDRGQLSKDKFKEMLKLYNLQVKADNFNSENRSYIDLYGDEDRIVRHIRDEKEIKRIDLIERCTKVVGEIKDASELHFGINEGINGIIVGEKGSANIHTIGAGGWNIQKFHFRVIVTPIKEKTGLDEKIAKASRKNGSKEEKRKDSIGKEAR